MEKKNGTRLAVVFWSLLLTAPGFCASRAGTSSFNFLKLSPLPRSSAMGDTGVSLADDLGSSYHNPAALAELGRQELAFTHGRWVEDISYQQAAYAHPTPGLGTLAGEFRYLSWGDIQGYDGSGTKTSALKLQDMAFGLAWGREGSLGFSYGAGLKYLQETLDTVSARTAAADLGAAWKPSQGPWARRFKYGLALRNLGPGPRFIETREKLPWTLGGGVSYKTVSEGIVVAAEFHKPSDNVFYAGLGGEAWLQDALALRMGFRTDQDMGNGFNAGFGIRLKDAQIDYAVTHLGALGYAHRVGLSYKFGGVVDALYRQGLGQMDRGDFEQALLTFDKVLMLKSGHRRALIKLKECHEKIVEMERER